MIMATTPETRVSTGNGARLVAPDGRELPLQSVHLAAQTGGGIARVTLTQRFKNPFAQPLDVRYLLPLPSDGAVSGFSFLLGDQRIVGEVTGRQQARRRFERALAQGKTAALLEQDRTSLFTQELGNIPPGGEITAEVVVDQPLRWLEEGEWEWRFPTVVGPRYQGRSGRVADARKLSVPVATDGSIGVRATLALSIDDSLTGPISSPSHALESRGSDPVRVQIEGDGAVRLDRDVVVRWPVALPSVSARVLAARPAAGSETFALLSVAPPTSGGVAVPRDLIFLIDTSGSMGGRPLDQAKRVAAAMIETLGPQDRLELIEFGSYPKRWEKRPQRATPKNKAKALKWLNALYASGATEMHRAVLEALGPLRAESMRQVVLITDGFIGFEQEIVRELLTNLPRGARLHTVGVGSAPNRSLTEAAARAGRGTELIVGLEEDADRVAHRLVARTTAPLVTDLVVEGAALSGVAPRQIPDLYAECPALIAVRTQGAGELILRGRTAEGPFEQRLAIPEIGPRQGPQGVVALFAREAVEDLETEITAGGDQRKLEQEIERLGVSFQISTRLTSWIAITKQATVAQVERKQIEQPHELPEGVSAEGLGLRPAKEPIPTIEVDATPDDLGGIHTMQDAKLLDSAADGLMQTEAFEIMDEPDSLLGGDSRLGGKKREVFYDYGEEDDYDEEDEFDGGASGASLLSLDLDDSLDYDPFADVLAESPQTISQEDAESVIRRITNKRILPPDQKPLTQSGSATAGLTGAGRREEADKSDSARGAGGVSRSMRARGGAPAPLSLWPLLLLVLLGLAALIWFLAGSPTPSQAPAPKAGATSGTLPGGAGGR